MTLPLPRYACCILLRARDAHVLLEARGPCAAIASNSLTCFGGKVEACDASVEVAVLRELMEELRWRPGAPLRFAVDLFVGGALTARFFVAEAPSEPEMLAVVQQEPGRGHAWLPLAAAFSADSRVSPWHRSVLEAFSRGAARADVAAPPFGGAPPAPRPFGFWRSGADPSLPLPVPSAPPPPADAAVLLRYLTAHALVESYEHGHSTCRLCGERSRALGCATLTDGAWLWPEGFAHDLRRTASSRPGRCWMPRCARMRRRAARSCRRATTCCGSPAAGRQRRSQGARRRGCASTPRWPCLGSLLLLHEVK